MQANTFSTFLLLFCELGLLVLFLWSDKVRQWADVIIAGLAGLFVHALVLQLGHISNDEWDVLTASIFILCFTMMRWSSLRKSFQESALQERNSDLHVLTSDPDMNANTEFHAQSDRLRTIGLMQTRLLHELSHPISTLFLRVAELKRNRFSDDKELFIKSITSIERQLQHLSQLTQNYKNYASGQNNSQSGFIPVQQIFSLTGEIVSGMTAGKSVVLSWPGKLPDICVTGGLTIHTQVLVNLIKNAVDAVSGLSENSQRWVKIEIHERGGAIEVSVSNGGAAISRPHQMNLFKPFFTTKRTGEGLGLGLSLCRELVDSVGGEIWYDEHSRHPRFVVRYSFLPAITNTNEYPETEEQIAQPHVA